MSLPTRFADGEALISQLACLWGWQTPIEQSGDGVLGCPSLLLSGQRQASSVYLSRHDVARFLSF